MIRLSIQSTILILLIMLFAGTDSPAAAQDSTCTESQLAALPSTLESGIRGRVLSGHVVNVRTAPTITGEKVGQIEAGATFDILDGPRCADGYVWWRLDDGAGINGWSAEGSAATEEFWLWRDGVPFNPAAVSRPFERAFVITPDGFSEPIGCLEPPDDYTRAEVGFATLNARTLAMLDQAGAIYAAGGGTLVDFRYAITQGSYNAGGVSASFGTHDAGGAVDLSVRHRDDLRILSREIEPMIWALRVAGFAAWLRAENQLEPGSPIHIHAIAIGDAEASPAAAAQVGGAFGYFNGYDALTPEYGGPNFDSHGGPVICEWMVNQGFVELEPN